MTSYKLADRTSAMAESATLALNAQVQQLAAQGKAVYNLTAGELDIETPDYIQTHVSKNLHHNKYTPVPGVPQLRQKIASTASHFYGLSWIKPGNVIVTAGAKPALQLALLALVNPGDEVLLPTPAWVSYAKLVELAGGKVIEVPLADNFDLDMVAITGKISARTKAIILNSPHNPTGAVFSMDSLKKLASSLKGSSVTVIADDIYVRLVYEKNFTPVPTVGFEKIVIVNGFSKSQALTGWRIGYAIADEKIIKAMTSLQSHMLGNAAFPAQNAALAALERGDNPPEGVLENLTRKRQIVLDVLKKIPGIKYHPPGGAFYVFLDLRQLTKDSSAWCAELLAQTGVAMVPGEAFEAPGFCRLTFATDEKTLKTALKLMRKFVEKGENS